MVSICTISCIGRRLVLLELNFDIKSKCNELAWGAGSLNYNIVVFTIIQVHVKLYNYNFIGTSFPQRVALLRISTILDMGT